MRPPDIFNYIKKLFNNDILLVFSIIGTYVYRFFFPEQQYFYGTLAVLAIMLLDLVTKLFAISKQSGGFKKAIKVKRINSTSFIKGTIDKLIVFIVMLILCGCAYRLVIISDLAVWFTQIVFTLMFLRDLLSIIENLNNAGVSGLQIFKKAVRKKMNEYVDEEETNNEDKLD